MELNLLLIEDSETDIELVKINLKEIINAKLDIAESLEKAKKLLLRNKYDVLLLDLNLPDSSGEETFEEILSVTSIPIIILTIKNDIELALSLVEKGADNYLFKNEIFQDPIDFCRQILFSYKRHLKEDESFEQDIRALKDSFKKLDNYLL